MRNDPQGGFTLIEVLVAIIVLTVGILAWTLTQNSNVRSRDRSTRLTTGGELVQSTIEEVSRMASSWTLAHGDDAGNSTTTLDSVTYSITWTADGSRVFDEGDSVWHIRAEVEWDHWGPHNVVMEKIVAGK